MRKTLALTTAALLAASTLPALASSHDEDEYRRGSGPQMSVEEITAKVSAMGYEVREVEKDDGYYEVYATDKNGVRVELKLDPATGDTVKTENKS